MINSGINPVLQDTSVDETAATKKWPWLLYIKVFITTSAMGKYAAKVVLEA